MGRSAPEITAARQSKENLVQRITDLAALTRIVHLLEMRRKTTLSQTEKSAMPSVAPPAISVFRSQKQITAIDSDHRANGAPRFNGLP